MTGFDNAFESGQFYNEWDRAEQQMWDDLTADSPQAHDSLEAQLMFDVGYFEPDLWTDSDIDLQEIHDSLAEYLEEFGIDFDQDFDYDAYREWYDAQG